MIHMVRAALYPIGLYMPLNRVSQAQSNLCYPRAHFARDESSLAAADKLRALKSEGVNRILNRQSLQPQVHQRLFAYAESGR